MSLFRSAQMKSFQIYFPKEDAYEIVSRLASNEFVQLIDTARDFQRPYTNSIKRCEEVVHKIDEVLNITRVCKVPRPAPPLMDELFENHAKILSARKLTSLKLLDEIEDQVCEFHSTICKLSSSQLQLDRKMYDLEDYKFLLFKAMEVFSSDSHELKKEPELDLSRTTMNLLKLSTVSGVMLSKDVLKFTRIIFRATKGNSLLYTCSIPKEDTTLLQTHAFILILEGGENLRGKVNRICDSFSAKTYPMPTNKEEVFEIIKRVEDDINANKKISAITKNTLSISLKSALDKNDYGCAKYEAYRVLLNREALIFSAMNHLQEIEKSKTKTTYLAQLWVTTEKQYLLERILPPCVTVREKVIPGKPPTHFEMNSFTAPFQEIIDTYGIPRYQQVNPALYAISIFPFLFGVMFGDIGHGGVLLCFSIFLIYSNMGRRLLPDIYAVRYLLLLMGIFAFYSGWIYNEFFSIPLNVFGSCYSEAEPEHYAQKQEGCVYPFGFDPKWIRASNELNYFNSYKMKFAVIIGVLQMSFAIMLKMLNSVYFRSYLDLIFEWVPQQLFFFSTFGYMCVLIIYKWTIPWDIERSSAEAPSIIGQMIALPLQLGSTQGKPLWDMQSQEQLQYKLLMLALICVPMMLIPKPLIIWLTMEVPKQDAHKPRSASHHNSTGDEENKLQQRLVYHEQQRVMDQDSFPPIKKDIHQLENVKEKVKTAEKVSMKAHSDQHDISQIVVHQIIQTIEFVLGSISNTASYLRLWALSLAHGQLSRVFFEKTVGAGIQSSNILTIMIGMYMFFNITLGIIMGMDTMECFLHALRLQWVEFNNKFFKADGWKFAPLQLKNPLQAQMIKFRTDQDEADSK